jgi:eukaryotic-like serine/threonine-protein kinase
MALTAGTRFGAFEIIGPLGAGGMGEVYRAHDMRLNRDVALKVLPDRFATDPDRLSRFQREAQVLASLNHPNIGAIYGLEESQGVRALVLEFVDGATLADRLTTNGPIALDEALPIARQIAEALEAAHEVGVIHRDLKPANIKLRPNGAIKVLDFGLAKLLGPAEATETSALSPSLSPTMTSPAVTQLGVILGTAAYMSPEQAKGNPLDKRTDIWSFGCVFYEMLTGRSPFEGSDLSDTLANVLKSDLDWNRLPAETPATIRRLLRRCLEKNTKARVPDIAIARFEITDVLSGAGTEPPGTVHAPAIAKRGKVRWTGILAGTAIVSGMLVAAGMWIQLKPVPPKVVRLTVASRPGQTPGTGAAASDVAITPDGQYIVYATGEGVNDRQLHVRAVDQLDAVTLGGVIASGGPFTSPDSKWIGFMESAGSTALLKTISISGGPAVKVATVPAGPGGSWGGDSSIILAAQGLFRLNTKSGSSEQLTKIDPEKGEFRHNLPSILPDGRGVLFTIVMNGESADNAAIAVADLKTGARKTLLAGGSNPVYVSSGHIVYGVPGGLRAVPFDLNRLEIRGAPTPVVDHVFTKQSGAASFAVASNGTLVYISGEASTNVLRTLVWVDRQGHEEPVGVPDRAYAYARISPDGTRLALDIRDQENDTWIWDLAHPRLQRLTTDKGLNRGVAWSSDGLRVAFSVSKEGAENVYWQRADGTGTPDELTTGSGQHAVGSFTPDGKFFLFLDTTNPPTDVSVVSLDGSRRSQRILHEPFNESNPEISPDGKWLAYESTESGSAEIYVRPWPNVDAGHWLVSTGGGTRPTWSRDGRELFYYLAPGKIFTVPIQSSLRFTAGTPSLVVDGQYLSPYLARQYDVSPDGKRFLLIKDASPSETTPHQLVVVLNWLDELKRLVPTK